MSRARSFSSRTRRSVMIARYASPVAIATARRAWSASRSDTSTSSSAWLRSAQRTGVSSGTLTPPVVTVCVRGLMLVP